VAAEELSVFLAALGVLSDSWWWIANATSNELSVVVMVVQRVAKLVIKVSLLATKGGWRGCEGVP
jgi:hypothetical protein